MFNNVPAHQSMACNNARKKQENKPQQFKGRTVPDDNHSHVFLFFLIHIK